jgi:hypothetical protein
MILYLEASALLVCAFSEGQLEPDRLALTALVFISLTLALIPLLFRIGRIVASQTTKRGTSRSRTDFGMVPAHSPPNSPSG